MEFDNPDLLLKPDMFADITIEAGAIEDAIAVPSEAIIRSGIRQQVFIFSAHPESSSRAKSHSASAVMDGHRSRMELKQVRKSSYPHNF